MLANLEKALYGKGITKKAYAMVLGITEKTLQNKIKEEAPFTYREARKTKREILPEYDLDYLFASDKGDV